MGDDMDISASDIVNRLSYQVNARVACGCGCVWIQRIALDWVLVMIIIQLWRYMRTQRVIG